MVSLTLIFICKLNSTNRVSLLKNTFCTLCLRGWWGFHAMPFLNCNFLPVALIMELIQVCLVVCQTLGEGARVQMFCWYVRKKLGSQFSLVAYEECLEDCFVVLLQERSMYGTLSQLSYLWDLDKQEQKDMGDAQKSSIGGGDASDKRGALFIQGRQVLTM